MSESVVKQTESAPDGVKVEAVTSPSSKRKLWIAVVVLVVVLGIALGGWKLLSHKSPKQPSDQPVTAADLTKVQNEVETTVNASHGSTATGLQTYDTAIKNATDDKTRASLDMQAADLASNNNELDTALTYAQKADAILHSDTSSSLIADIYQQKGDTANAVTYYKKAAAEVNTSLPGGYSSSYYLAKAQEVQAEAKQ